MMNHKRILIALGSTEGEDAAFERGLALAKASGAELYLLHAVPANQPYSYRAAERLQRSAELHRRTEAAGVNAQSVEQHGDPAEIILLHADGRSVDLIVMGTEGRTGWARWRQPSVAEQVLRRTKRPTLVVRGDDKSGAAFDNVLVAVDLSPASTGLVKTALQILGGKRRQFTVVHAVEGIEAAADVRNRARWMVPEYRRYVLNEARRRLADVLPATGSSDITSHVAAGPATETIGAYAAAVDADLVVMGRTKRFMDLGSTGVRILRNTDHALLIIPPEVSEATHVEHSLHQRTA
jgi:nucleotide-binding universal stress UspA family protein